MRLTATAAFHCGRNLFERNSRAENSRIVEQDIDAAEGGFRFAKQGFDKRGIGHIPGNRDGSRAKRPSLHSPRLKRLLASSI